MSENSSIRYLRRLEHALFDTACDHPRLSLSSARAVLEVAVNGAPIGYRDLADRLGLDHQKVSSLAGTLSDGRGDLAGRNLLERVPGRDRREKLLQVTRAGQALCDRLASVDQDGPASLGVVSTMMGRLTAKAGEIRLASAFILLRIGLNDQIIRDYGLSAVSIFQNRPVNNLPNHLNALRGEGLVTRVVLPDDKKTKPPVLTESGRELISELHALAPDPRSMLDLEPDYALEDSSAMEPEPY